MEFVTFCCDPDGIRTHDRLLRRQMLYPAELPDRPFVSAKLHRIFGLAINMEIFLIIYCDLLLGY